MEEETGQLGIGFGSSDKTSDFMVEALEARGNAWDAQEPTTTELLQSKMDNGPESSGGRTQFRHRLVQFADPIGKPLHLRYYPPDHSKYTPLERCWGIVALHWNGTTLRTSETMLEWAKSMTWKGLPPVVELSRKVYQKGVSLSKKAMPTVESRLERHPELPKWDILIRPASTA